MNYKPKIDIDFSNTEFYADWDHPALFSHHEKRYFTVVFDNILFEGITLKGHLKLNTNLSVSSAKLPKDLYNVGNIRIDYFGSDIEVKKLHPYGTSPTITAYSIAYANSFGHKLDRPYSLDSVNTALRTTIEKKKIVYYANQIQCETFSQTCNDSAYHKILNEIKTYLLQFMDKQSIYHHVMKMRKDYILEKLYKKQKEVEEIQESLDEMDKTDYIE